MGLTENEFTALRATIAHWAGVHAEAFRTVSGVSSAKIAAAARLYPNIFCCDDCANARSRR